MYLQVVIDTYIHIVNKQTGYGMRFTLWFVLFEKFLGKFSEYLLLCGADSRGYEVRSAEGDQTCASRELRTRYVSDGSSLLCHACTSIDKHLTT